MGTDAGRWVQAQPGVEGEASLVRPLDNGGQSYGLGGGSPIRATRGGLTHRLSEGLANTQAPPTSGNVGTPPNGQVNGRHRSVHADVSSGPLKLAASSHSTDVAKQHITAYKAELETLPLINPAESAPPPI